jgi:hypothetical protein
MATTRKSAKRTARKKTSGRKRASAGKKAVRRKAVSRRSSPKTKGARKKKKGTPLSRRAAQGLRAARGGVKSVRQAGDKIWEALRSTTAHVVEGVKDRLAEETEREARHRS